MVAGIYAEHSEDLKRFLLGLLRDSQLASDVLQATFVKMLERGHETKEESRRAWLFRVAYNEAMLFRRRQTTGEKVLKKLSWIKEGWGTSAAEPVVRFESVELIREAMDQLPEPQKQIVHMRVYEEKTFAVIAEELDIPLGTALARMHSALKKLKQKLTKLNESES